MLARYGGKSWLALAGCWGWGGRYRYQPPSAPGWSWSISRRRDGHAERHERGNPWRPALAAIRYVRVGAVVLGSRFFSKGKRRDRAPLFLPAGSAIFFIHMPLIGFDWLIGRMVR